LREAQNAQQITPLHLADRRRDRHRRRRRGHMREGRALGALLAPCCVPFV
jgi:hypothetical protein